MDMTSRDIRLTEMKDAVTKLNNTVESLKKAFEESKAREAQKDQKIEDMKAIDAQKDQKIASLEEKVAYLTKKIFAAKSEKSKDFPGQLNLFNEVEAERDPSVPEQVEPINVDELQTSDTSEGKTRKKRHTNREKYANCRQRNEYLDIDEAERICPLCGSLLEKIGEELVRQEIHVVPGYVEIVNVYSRNYGCPECKKGSTSLPYIVKGKDGKPHMMKGMVSASTVAWIMYQKYCNSNPLYRQEKEWENLYGLKVTRATFANWVIDNADEFFRPVYSELKRQMLAGEFLMGDETPIQVLHELDRKAQTKSYMWVFRTGEDSGLPIILYNYTQTRAGENALKFLGDYGGYFMCDGFGGYNKLPRIKRCSCWAHVRRCFLEAIPAEKKEDLAEPAVQGCLYVEKLFVLEKESRKKNKGHDTIKKERDKKERPVIEAFFAWIDKQKPVKGSRFAKAVTYCQNRRQDLMTYLEDGRCSLSNNLTEQGCKAFVIGRKNWLFSDQPVGARTSAVIYSLVQTAKLNGANPYYYLRYVLEEMSSYPNCENLPEQNLQELMPWSGKLKEAVQRYEKNKDRSN